MHDDARHREAEFIDGHVGDGGLLQAEGDAIGISIASAAIEWHLTVTPQASSSKVMG